MSRGRCVVAVAVACVLAAGGGVFAETIWVPDDYATIQGAIDAAVDGDEIAVRPGTYNEAINFLGKAIRLYSTDGPDVTTIDATGLETSVVTCQGGQSPDTVLDGFTITGGVATHGGGMYISSSTPTVTNCSFVGNTAYNAEGRADGGGMYISSSGATVTNCSFVGNTVRGAWAHGGFGGGISSNGATVTNCSFVGNAANGPGGAGGGMVEGSGTVTNCTFRGNWASGWYSGGGGGMLVWGNATVATCTFTENTATGSGGGMLNSYHSTATITNCTFEGNEAHGGEEALGGGGMYNHESSPTVTNSTFINNYSEEYGSAICNYASSPTFMNCTFIRNVTFYSAAIDSVGGGVAVVTNSILWDNDGPEILGNATVSYSDVQGGYAGVGNMDLDPLCDADGRPQTGSPCIDAGVNNAVPADTLDLDEDGDVAERLPLDLDGNPRFADDPDADDAGCGLPVVVDMGVYEYQGVPVETVIVGDVDGDGVVDFADLLDVLRAWGDCDAACCLADQDFNWVVDVREILLVLGGWG